MPAENLRRNAILTHVDPLTIADVALKLLAWGIKCSLRYLATEDYDSQRSVVCDGRSSKYDSDVCEQSKI